MPTMKHKNLLINIPWLGILLLIILSISFLLPVLPNDFWWYLRLGQEIQTNLSVPTVDTYSSTVSGQTVSYPMWLAAVVLNGLYKIGDLSAVVFARGIFIAIFYVFLWLICMKKGLPGWLSTLLTIICALAGANNWAVRPQMFVYFLFGITLFLLSSNNQISQDPPNDKSLQKSFSKYFYLLIPIALLWANLHGSVIILLFIVIPYLLFQQRNLKFFLLVLLIILATCINPRGPMIWLDTFQLMQANGNQFSQEWKPPINTGWQMNLFFFWLLSFVPLAVFSSNKLKLYEWVWFLGFGWMALSGTRYVIWFLAILLILTSWLLQGFMKRKLTAFTFSNIPINFGILVILTFLPIFLLPGIRDKWWALSPETVSINTPVEATTWLKQHPELPEPLFNDYIYGSYLIYALPERTVWIDTRFYPFPTEIWEDYLLISNAEPGWQQKLNQYNIGTFMLDKISQDRLTVELRNSIDFCNVFENDDSIIFTKCE